MTINKLPHNESPNPGCHAHGRVNPTVQLIANTVRLRNPEASPPYNAMITHLAQTEHEPQLLHPSLPEYAMQTHLPRMRNLDSANQITRALNQSTN